MSIFLFFGVIFFEKSVNFNYKDRRDPKMKKIIEILLISLLNILISVILFTDKFDVKFAFDTQILFTISSLVSLLLLIIALIMLFSKVFNPIIKWLKN